MYAREFNQLYAHPENKALIRKALTSGSGVGGALIPEKLETVITTTAVRLVPELAMPVLKYDPQKYHEFNRLTTLPSAGSAMGENSTTPTRNSVFARANVELKIMKRKGAVTGFLQDASEGYKDASASELESHVQAFGNDLRTYMVYGNRGADAYTFDGLDKFIATNRTTVSTAVQTDLSLLDEMIDANVRRQGNSHRKAFLISPELLSQLSRLWTVVRDTRPADVTGTTMERMVSGGYRLETYRGVPFLETTVTRPTGTMTTVTTASAGSGSGIPDDQYFFRVAPVTWEGEQMASAEANVTTSSADTITLSFTAYPGALYYKVYCGLATGVLALCKVFSAFTYDADGTITGNVASLQFTSNPSTPDATSVPTHMQSDVPLVATGGIPAECLILWDLDEFQGMGKVAYTNKGGSRFKGLITPMEIYRTDDNYPFLLKSYSALVDSFEATSYLARGLRVA
jgi:hypothetical protein